MANQNHNKNEAAAPVAIEAKHGVALSAGQSGQPLCKECGRTIVWPSTTKIEASSKELRDSALHMKDDPYRVSMAIGSASAFLHMVVGCMDDVCVICRPVISR